MRRPSFASGLAALALAGTSWLPGTGLSHADASVCGSLSLGSGASVPGSELQDVTFVSAREAWAVGDVFDTGTRENRTLVERYNGSGWSRVPSPNQSAGNSGLDSISMIPGGGWAVGYARQVGGSYQPRAVGYYDDGSVKRPLALHWNGSSWHALKIPGAGLLRKIKVISRSNVWADGTYYVPGERTTKTLLVHFDGTAWKTVQSADSTSNNNQLIGIAADGSGSSLTLVGRHGPNTLVEQATCPTGPVSLPTRAATAAPSPPAAPGIVPAPTPPPRTPPAGTPVPVTFTDRAAAAGIDENGAVDWTFSAVTADFNGDGWPDLFVAHHWHPGHMYLNNHDGTFREVNASYFKLIPDRHDCHD